ncbi:MULTISPECIES: chitinase [Deefgea]|nr:MULTISPECIES: carbohydrate-binding protein [Deefgea]
MIKRNRATLASLLAGLVLASGVHAASWQEGNTYTAGTVVDYNGKTYTALVSHTAYVGTGWNPAAAPTLWKETGSVTPTVSVTPTISITPTVTPTITPTPTTYQCPQVTPPPYPAVVLIPPASWGITIIGKDSNGCNIEGWKGVCPIGSTFVSNQCVPSDPIQPAWDKATVYTGGQRISYNGSIYEAKWWTQGDVPGASEWGPWKLVSVGATATPTATPSSKPTCLPMPMPTGIPGYRFEPIYDGNGCIIGWNKIPTATATPTVTVSPTPTISVTPSVTPTVTPTPSVTPAPANDKLLIGYLHASFANGSGYIRMNDVSDKWDYINLSFAEPTSATSGEVAFKLCPSTECPNVESEADFIAAIKAKQAKGKKVQISIGGANGQVRLETSAAKDAFVRSVSAIIDKYGLDGLDVDFEGHSLQLNAGDNDVANPKSPVIVNLIAALKELKAKYGSKFTLTMAPETFFVQLGYAFYGGNCAGCDTRAGAYLPVIYALRDDITLLHVQDYNSGPITGLDNAYHTMGNADFHVAMTDMLLKGFKVSGTNFVFPALRPDQVAIGLPANANAGGGFTTVGDVHTALDCLMKGTSCGSYKPSAVYPGLRGLMTWSINWDKFNNFEFSTQHRAYFDKLPK